MEPGTRIAVSAKSTGSIGTLFRRLSKETLPKISEIENKFAEFNSCKIFFAWLSGQTNRNVLKKAFNLVSIAPKGQAQWLDHRQVADQLG